MFINQHGPPSQNPAIRRAINIHLSNVARQKRPRKYDVEKLDRRQAQQQRRAREAAQYRNLRALEDEALILMHIGTPINQTVPGQFLQPNLHVTEDKIAMRACRDCTSHLREGP